MNLPERPWKTIKNGDEAEKSEGDGAGAVKGSSELENGEDRAASDNIPPPSNPPSNPVPPSQYKFDKERGVWEFSGPGSGNTFGGRSDEESRTNENGSAAGNHDAVSAEIRRITNATYAKRRTKSEKWTDEETEKFYEALSMCGTDFTLAVPLFPGRNQRQLKNKYTREERADPARVAQALKRRTKLGGCFFLRRWFLTGD
ncbi:hypothetical protein M427DRAFT_98592 [Gonapodya prolifera JEL478]|uniref:Myb-like domain-containing protein n=1 Tax=Gonapodya prolifera (strain JEL478) TaxID=1344416 RepID=A0A139AGV3_GONPJ|nr:hypothetical protein M427DRAFT_98592 [Gonapodya prolifera JEL478]|eukprot:KXS15643.1 hypothetical protein M427DRAFT_98592 [Gonapodya prolifera JEL478]